MLCKAAKAFSFIEVLIVLAIIGVLLFFATPNWQVAGRKGPRVQVQVVLLENALWLSQFYSRNHSYLRSLEGEAPQLPQRVVEASGAVVYRIAFESQTEDSYVLAATPEGKMADDECRSFSLNHLGERKAARDNCWTR